MSSYLRMNEIVPGLWLGGVYAANDLASLRSNNIGRVVTVCDENSLVTDFIAQYGEDYPFDEFKQLFICAMDSVYQDLMEHFDDCFQFIREGLDSGKGVLVHCQVGVSRSATMVIAYLMHRDGLSLNDATKKVSAARPMISPNPGFMSQLSVFETMGGRRVDRDHPAYRQYRLTRLARDNGCSTAPPPADIPCAEDPGQEQPQAATAAAATYRCRRCRRPLFRPVSLMSHRTYQAKGGPAWHRGAPMRGGEDSGSEEEEEGDEDSEKKRPPGDGECRRELFVEPVEWMRATAGSEVSGKLACPKCSAKVGSFTWVGERCSCGQFVCPAFHVRSQAVDAPATVRNGEAVS